MGFFTEGFVHCGFCPQWVLFTGVLSAVGVFHLGLFHCGFCLFFFHWGFVHSGFCPLRFFPLWVMSMIFFSLGFLATCGFFSAGGFVREVLSAGDFIR